MITLNAIEADLVLSLLGQVQQNNNLCFSLKEKLKAAGATEKFSVGLEIKAVLKPVKWVSYRELKPGRWEIYDGEGCHLLVAVGNTFEWHYYLVDSLGNKQEVRIHMLWDKQFRLLE